MKNADSRVLTKEECEEFYAKWDDEEVKKEFFNHNIRLVHYVAGKYTSTGIDYDDLFQSASIGLWKSIKTFIPSKGYQFATYATRVMTNEILMMLRSARRCPLIDDKKIVSMDSPLNTDADGNTLTFDDILAASCLDIDDSILGSELDTYIQKFLSNYNQRNVNIVKMYLDGKTQKMIADYTSISQSYVSRIINKFKRDLKKYLKKEWSDDIHDWS